MSALTFRIAILRKEAGLTQDVLRKKVKVSRTRLSQLENAQGPTGTVKTLTRIAAVLKVPVWTLFSEALAGTDCCDCHWDSCKDCDNCRSLS